MAAYRTSDLARMVGIHPNTVRLYERLGYFSPVPRAENGYRLFSERHVYQLRVCRCIFSCDWVGSEVRQASLRVIKAMARWDLAAAQNHAVNYLALVEQQIAVAKETMQILGRWAEGKGTKQNDSTVLNRNQAAKVIGVTPETLRSWERNGLIVVSREGANRKRVYGTREIERLRIIYMLRQARYSIAAILRSMRKYDSGDITTVLPALSARPSEEDEAWITVGDRWLAALKSVAEGARQILDLIAEAQAKNI